MPGNDRRLQNYDVVAGVNNVVSEALGSREQAERDLRSLAPQLFEDTSEAGQKRLAANLNTMQRAIELEKAQAEESALKRFFMEKVANRPRNIFEVSLDTGRHPLSSLSVSPTVGEVLDFGSLGPESLEEDPAGFAAAGAATLASGGVAGRMGSALTARARSLLGKRAASGRLAGAIETGEQIFAPAAAAGIAGGVVEYGRGPVAEANGVPELRVGNDPNGESPISNFAAAMNQARNQFVFESAGGALGALGMLGIKTAANFARGDKEHFDNAVRALREAGLREHEINLMTVSNRALFSSAGRTVGAVPIPILSKRFRDAERRKAAGLTREQYRIMGDLSPRYRLILDRLNEEDGAEAAVELMQASKEQFFRTFNNAVGRYRTVREGVDKGLQASLAREGGNIKTPAATTRAAALYLVTQRAKKGSDLPSITEVTEVASRILDPNGNPLSVTNRARRDVRTFNLDDTELNEILNDIKGMDREASLNQLINLRDNITARLDMDDPNRALSKSDAAALFELGAALDNDIEQALLEQGSEGLKHQYERLKALDSDWITLITGSQASNRAKRVQKTFGQQKLSEASGESVDSGPIQRAQGSLDMEEFLDSMLSGASPEEIRQVGILMRQSGKTGDEMMRFAAARQLDRVIQPALREVTDDRVNVVIADVIRKAINGKEGPLGKQAIRFWSLVKEAGGSRSDVEKFIKGADQLWRSLPADQNTFLMRNIILNRGDFGSMFTKAMGLGVLGVGAGTGAAGVAATGGNLINAVIGVFALERFTHLVTDPRALKAVNTILDPNTGRGAKARAIDRLLANNVFREWGDEKRRAANIQPATDAVNKAMDVYNRFDLPNDPVGKLTDEAARVPNIFDGSR